MELAREHQPDVVFCDYDVLVSSPIELWENDPVLVRIPIIAVSLTRRHDEAQSIDVNGHVPFLYLPTLSERAAKRIMQTASVAAAVVRAPSGALRSTDGAPSPEPLRAE